MITNSTIIGIFIKKNKVLSFLEMLEYKFKIDLSKVHVNEIDTNNFEYLVTFKVKNKDNFIKKIKGCSVVHVKNGTIFSINALNKLIELENKNSDTPNGEYVLDWNKYKDKLIITSNGELSISNLSKIEDFTYFFGKNPKNTVKK